MPRLAQVYRCCGSRVFARMTKQGYRGSFGISLALDKEK
jgi:hypothetical protein